MHERDRFLLIVPALASDAPAFTGDPGGANISLLSWCAPLGKMVPRIMGMCGGSRNDTMINDLIGEWEMKHWTCLNHVVPQIPDDRAGRRKKPTCLDAGVCICGAGGGVVVRMKTWLITALKKCLEPVGRKKWLADGLIIIKLAGEESESIGIAPGSAAPELHTKIETELYLHISLMYWKPVRPTFRRMEVLPPSGLASGRMVLRGSDVYQTCFECMASLFRDSIDTWHISFFEVVDSERPIHTFDPRLVEVRRVPGAAGHALRLAPTVRERHARMLQDVAGQWQSALDMLGGEASDSNDSESSSRSSSCSAQPSQCQTLGELISSASEVVDSDVSMVGDMESIEGTDQEEDEAESAAADSDNGQDEVVAPAPEGNQIVEGHVDLFAAQADEGSAVEAPLILRPIVEASGAGASSNQLRQRMYRGPGGQTTAKSVFLAASCATLRGTSPWWRTATIPSMGRIAGLRGIRAKATALAGRGKGGHSGSCLHGFEQAGAKTLRAPKSTCTCPNPAARRGNRPEKRLAHFFRERVGMPCLHASARGAAVKARSPIRSLDRKVANIGMDKIEARTCAHVRSVQRILLLLVWGMPFAVLVCGLSPPWFSCAAWG